MEMAREDCAVAFKKARKCLKRQYIQISSNLDQTLPFHNPLKRLCLNVWKTRNQELLIASALQRLNSPRSAQ